MLFWTGCIIYNGYADQDDERAYEVVAVRFEVIYFPGPEEGENDEDATIGGVDSSEAGGLPGGDNAIGGQNEASNDAVPNGFVGFEVLPNKVASTDLAKTGENKYGQGFEDVHGAFGLDL
jgi:hypothetical protein